MKPLTIGLTVAALATSAFLWKGGDLLLQNDNGLPTETPAVAQPARVNHTIFAGGVVEGATREVPLNFEIAGRVVAINATEGSHVSSKKVLIRLDDTVLQHDLARAESRLALATAERERLVNGASSETRRRVRAEAELTAVQVEQAKLDAERALAAFKRDAITKEVCDQYRYRLKSAVADLKRANARVAETEAAARTDELRMADARIKLAEAEVDQAKTMISKTILLAPTDAVVLKVDVELGERITSQQTQPVITLVDNRRIQVRAYVEELDAIALKLGQSATVVADGLPEHRYEGKITWIAPSMQPKSHRHDRPGERHDTRVREILIEIDKPRGLVIGLPVDVFIEPP